MHRDLKLSFIHIPKTAGISLTTALMNHYFHNENTFQIRSESDRLCFLNSSYIIPDNLYFIAGHISFFELLQKGINFPCISIVRHPIERLNSLLNYVNESSIDIHKNKFHNSHEFISFQESLQQNNMQCWHFAEDKTAISAIDIIRENKILTRRTVLLN